MTVEIVPRGPGFAVTQSHETNVENAAYRELRALGWAGILAPLAQELGEAPEATQRAR